MRAPLHAHFLPGTGPTLVVAFSGVGRDPARPPAREFHAMASDEGRNPVLFLADAARSWLNAPGLAEEIADTIARVKRECGAQRVVALGNSMGGSMALLMSRLVCFDAILAVAPQVSVSPVLMPDERRWLSWRNRIGTWRFPTLADRPPEAARSLILHGDAPDEMAHAVRFPTAPEIDHLIVPGHGHSMVRRLKRAGVLGGMVSSMVEGQPRNATRALREFGARPLRARDRSQALRRLADTDWLDASAW